MAVQKSEEFHRIYVWELPVRFYHWINAVCVLLLIVTGYLIGKPVSISYSAEAYQQYWFGITRFIHFVAAFVFFFNFVYRIYWGFAGNKYSRWYNFIPYKKSQLDEMKEILSSSILIPGPL